MIALKKIAKNIMLRAPAYKFSNSNVYDVVIIGGGHAGC